MIHSEIQLVTFGTTVMAVSNTERNTSMIYTGIVSKAPGMMIKETSFCGITINITNQMMKPK